MHNKHTDFGMEEIIQTVTELEFPVGQYVVVGGAVLAAHGLRKTHDIDIVGSAELLKTLKQNGWDPALRPSGEPGLCKGVVEVYPDVNCLAYQCELSDLIKRAENIGGMAFATLQDILLFKRGYGREKDKRDIELIQRHLASTA